MRDGRPRRRSVRHRVARCSAVRHAATAATTPRPVPSCHDRLCIICKFWIRELPEHALHEKFTETNRRRYIGQKPETKSSRGPANISDLNRMFFFSYVFFGADLHIISILRASEQASRIVIFSVLKGKRVGCFRG